ncbi:MAG: DinB family protein [Bryobacterales bacterium]|nr:DinB family protein [Bryobacterales bacterium]
MITVPDACEYAPYFGRYISQVEGKDLIAALTAGIAKTEQLLAPLSEGQALQRYAEGKWSIKQVIGHLIDAERVFSYRALRYARLDQNQLHSFDENAFVANARFDEIPLADLVAEFAHLRQANVLFYRNLSEEELSRTGVANNNRMSVRALGWTMAGHEVHHVRILEERYLRP